MAHSDQNRPLEILPVANGYIVRGAYRDNCSGDIAGDHVFQSFGELVAHLEEKLDFRCEGDLLSDKPTGS